MLARSARTHDAGQRRRWHDEQALVRVVVYIVIVELLSSSEYHSGVFISDYVSTNALLPSQAEKVCSHNMMPREYSTYLLSNFHSTESTLIAPLAGIERWLLPPLPIFLASYKKCNSNASQQNRTNRTNRHRQI